MNEYGVVIEPGALRLERVLPGPVERVWSYLTDSDKRGQWLAPGQMDLRVGGPVELRFNHEDLSRQTGPTPERYRNECNVTGHVTRCDPPRLLSYTWGESSGSNSEVTFELTPRGKDVLMVITHRRLGSRDAMVNVASGWHAHVGFLIDVLSDREPPDFWAVHARLAADYAQRIATP